MKEISNIISVFQMNHPQESLERDNGVILQPTMCEINEELNADYSLVMSHPIDEDSRWKYITPFSIIKACGQLFRIYRMQTTMSSQGEMQRTVFARHIWYDLNDKLMNNWAFTGSGRFVIKAVGNKHYWYDDDHGYYPFYNFEAGSSDLEDDVTVMYENISPSAALIGVSNCLANVCKGELHRDKFYYSMNKRKEGSRDDAFSIQYGVDMTEIEEVIDYSNFASYLISESGGNKLMTSYVGSDFFPHNFVKHIDFNYRSFDWKVFEQDAHAYFDANCVPEVSYRVQFASLKKIDGYKSFGELQHCNVGDTGRIVNQSLGIDTVQKVVRKVTNAIDGTVVSMQLNNVSRTFTQPNPFKNVIAPYSPSTTDAFFTYNK